MGMTPSDVEQKTFSTALRGYDLDEVDDFLDDVVSTIRDLQDQIAEAKASKPTTTSTIVEDESAIGRVLVTAQATADTMIADARDEASQILAEARIEADSWEAERSAEQAEAEVEMAELTRHVSGVRNQLAVLATAVADRLDEMDEAISGQGQIGQDSDTDEDVIDDVANETVGYVDDDDSEDDEVSDQESESDSADEDDVDDDSGVEDEFSSGEESDEDE